MDCGIRGSGEVREWTVELWVGKEKGVESGIWGGRLGN